MSGSRKRESIEELLLELDGLATSIRELLRQQMSDESNVIDIKTGNNVSGQDGSIILNGIDQVISASAVVYEDYIK